MSKTYSDEELFEMSIREGRMVSSLLYVGTSHSFLKENYLIISPKTGQTYEEHIGSYSLREIAFPDFKRKAILDMRAKVRKRQNREVLIRKNAPLINKIRVIRSLGERRMKKIICDVCGKELDSKNNFGGYFEYCGPNTVTFKTRWDLCEEHGQYSLKFISELGEKYETHS